MNHSEWRVLASYASGFEADIAVALLESADIPAIRDNNDTVGIFGPGFQGPSARGILVRVPADYLESARVAVGLPAHQLTLVEPSDEDEESGPMARDRVIAGVTIGMGIAVPMFIVFFFRDLMRTPVPAGRVGSVVARALVAWFGGFLIAGVVGGLLYPLGRTRFGGIVVALIVGLIVFAAVSISMVGVAR